MGGRRRRGGDRLHDLDGDAMNSTRQLDSFAGDLHPAGGSACCCCSSRAATATSGSFALVVSLLTFVVSLHLPVHLHRSQPGFQFEINIPWIPTPNIHYHMGVDGISMWLVVLTTFLTPLVRADFVEVDS